MDALLRLLLFLQACQTTTAQLGEQLPWRTCQPLQLHSSTIYMAYRYSYILAVGEEHFISTRKYLLIFGANTWLLTMGRATQYSTVPNTRR